MTAQKILSEALNKNPLGLKEELTTVLNDKIDIVLENLVDSLLEEKLDELLRLMPKRSFSKSAHVVSGIGDEKEGEGYVSMKDRRTGARYKVRPSQIGNVPYIEEVQYMDEEVLKYGKEYVDNKIKSGEWKFLQGARKPGAVFTVKDMEKNEVMAIMYDIKK